MKEKYYFMAACVITFISPDGDPMDTSINVLVTNTTPIVTKSMLERIQVDAQVQLAKSLGDKLPDVKHVFIMSISNLGLMSEKTFLSAEVKNELSH